jgi:lysophospholipase L1-like esterase
MKTNLKCINIILAIFLLSASALRAQTMVQVNASDPNIQYTGRINNADPNNVLFAYPGVSIKATFQGTAINAVFTDYSGGGSTTTTYFNVIIDGGTPTKLKLTSMQTVYSLATGLTDATHTVELFKITEASSGKVAFKGFQLVSGKTLVASPPLPSRRIEFIGDSQTCGYGNESSANPPVSGFTSINENNYKAWSATTARNLGAQYSCVAYSGRGLYRNNSGTTTGVLPQLYDQTIPDDASVTWDHTQYTPDVIVINLGTNDYAAEAANAAYKVGQPYIDAYSAFITKLRGYYPNASIICHVGVMMSDYYPAGASAWTRIQTDVKSVVTAKNTSGDKKVYYYMSDPQSPPYGEDYHPTAATDAMVATGLTNYINSVVTWNVAVAPISLAASVTPSTINNSGATVVKFTATASATSPNAITQVLLDLTSLGGANAVVMTSMGANAYEYSFNVAAGLSTGIKSVSLTASDNAAHTKTATLSVEVGGGIVISSATVNPTNVVNNVDNNLVFNVNATDDGSIGSVKIDLSSIGGGAAVAMSNAGSNNYSVSYTIPINAAVGTKTVPVTVTDNLGNKKTTTISFTVSSSFTYTDIYTDASTMICANCFWTGATTDVVVEQSNAGAIEGVKDYKFSYTIANYWAGMGFNISNWSDANAKDFSSYDSIQVSYKGPIGAGTGFNFSLIGLAKAKSTTKALPASSTYTTVKIGMKEFGAFDLTKITQLGIDITGAASGTGSLQIDNMRLIKGGTPLVTTNDLKNLTLITQVAYPNPFFDAFNFSVNSIESSNATIRILNVLGKVMYESSIIKTNERVVLGTDLPLGIYFIEAVVNGQKRITKICKQ